MKYLILQYPGHSWVYYINSDKLAIAELTLALEKASISFNSIQVETIQNVRYLSFETEKILKNADLDILSRLSFVFAIFEQVKLEDSTYLKPLEKINYEFLDSKVSSLLKYHGKTNELFTKLMINVALLTSDFSYNDDIKLLDPVCGRGTTLFEASIFGFDAYGIEIDSKHVHETSIFFKKYLETERLKHASGKRQIYGDNKSKKIFVHEFEYALSKEDFKFQNKRKEVAIVNGSSKDAYKYFKKPMFHLIVGDLPYGVVHGSTDDVRGFTRNPSELIEDSLSEWIKVLLKGGTIVLAWNTFLVSFDKLSQMFESFGFSVLSQAPYDQFEHMVDKSIKRNIIVAKKGL